MLFDEIAWLFVAWTCWKDYLAIWLFVLMMEKFLNVICCKLRWNFNDLMLFENVKILVFCILIFKCWFWCWKCSWMLWNIKFLNHLYWFDNVMSMKLRSYIWDNVWVVTWLCIKYWHLCFNRDSQASLMI